MLLLLLLQVLRLCAMLVACATSAHSPRPRQTSAWLLRGPGSSAGTPQELPTAAAGARRRCACQVAAAMRWQLRRPRRLRRRQGQILQPALVRMDPVITMGPGVRQAAPLDLHCSSSSSSGGGAGPPVAASSTSNTCWCSSSSCSRRMAALLGLSSTTMRTRAAHPTSTLPYWMWRKTRGHSASH